MDTTLLKQLRKETGVSISDCKRALEQSRNDIKKAKALLDTWGVESATKRKDKQTEAGIVDSYIHSNKKIGVLLSLSCETDFVARTKEFAELSHELCMHIAAMDPKGYDELKKQAYIRDPKITIEELIKQAIAKLGENIRVIAFTRQAF